MDSRTITQSELCSLFDHTNLKPFAGKRDFEILCREAAENHFAMVAVNSSPVPWCREFLAGTGVHVGAAISFPLGQTPLEVKAFETHAALEQGADEIDYVLNIGELKQGNWDYIRREMETIVRICRGSGALCKVIFENCYLSKQEIAQAAAIAAEIGPDFIKTSTGFGPSGAKAADVELMAEACGHKIRVKAAGGIRSWKVCVAMIDAGAERIGTSSSLEILREFREARKTE